MSNSDTTIKSVKDRTAMTVVLTTSLKSRLQNKKMREIGRRDMIDKMEGQHGSSKVFQNDVPHDDCTWRS